VGVFRYSRAHDALPSLAILVWTYVNGKRDS
jgi:hypothetical protein